MKKILVYEGKHGNTCWDASTPEKEKAAFLALFELLDEVWDVYGFDSLNDKQKELYTKAKNNDAEAAEKLCSIRRRAEYEGWYFEYVRDPLKE